MQVAAEPPALLLAGRHQGLARVLQRQRELDGVHRRPGLAGEPVEQPQVAGVERRVGPRRDQQAADLLAAVHQPHRHRLATRRPE